MHPPRSYRPRKFCCTWPAPAVRQGVATLFLGLCFTVSVSWAAPIATNTALPLSADEIIVRQQFVMTRSSDRITGISRRVDRFESRTVLGYGYSSKLALFGVLPLVDVSTEIGAASASEFGLGDAALFARYEVFRSDRPGRTLRIAPYAGVRLPTGRDGKTGDGSVDVFGGVTNPNSGGFQLYLTPGLQYATRRWIADLGVKVPVVNDLNGMALEPDYSILTSIRINF